MGGRTDVRSASGGGGCDGLTWSLATFALLSLAVNTGCGDYTLDFGDKGPGVLGAPTAIDPARHKPGLWTLLDIRRAMAAGLAVAPTVSFPEGLPDLFLKPGPEGNFAMKINPAFSEGEPAAFIIPEVWLHFDVLWLQPWYVLVTEWNEKNPNSNRLKDPAMMNANVPPVWDVGPRSLFYSPFWVVFYAVVPPETSPERYRSAETLFDDGVPIHQGPAIIYSVRPDDVVFDAKPVHPYLGKETGNIGQSAASWVDGEKIAYFNEGSSNFRWDQIKLEVEEVPLFFFMRRDEGGAMVSVGAAPVMGSGPLFARRPVDAPALRPRFGAYSRFYFALVPPTAAVFEPDDQPDAVAVLQAKNLDPNVYRGRLASNGRKVAETDRACFDQPDFPMGCTWLDSQARVEDAVGTQNILRTEVSACSPLVFYGGKGIGR